jgi:hypothetical protein
VSHVFDNGMTSSTEAKSVAGRYAETGVSLRSSPTSCVSRFMLRLLLAAAVGKMR